MCWSSLISTPPIPRTNCCGELGGAEAIGPILVGMQKPIQVLATGAEVRDIFNMTTLAVIEARENA
jgi:malate dehydrogenase (oxaloacetate-decarboxylating)(NADP+)